MPGKSDAVKKSTAPPRKATKQSSSAESGKAEKSKKIWISNDDADGHPDFLRAIWRRAGHDGVLKSGGYAYKATPTTTTKHS